MLVTSQVPRHLLFLVCNKAFSAEQRASASFSECKPQNSVPMLCCDPKFALPSIAIYLMSYGRKKWGLSDCSMVSLKWFKWLSKYRMFLFYNLFSTIKLQVKAADHIKSNYNLIALYGVFFAFLKKIPHSGIVLRGVDGNVIPGFFVILFLLSNFKPIFVMYFFPQCYQSGPSLHY